jgi:hypothetical protein
MSRDCKQAVEPRVFFIRHIDVGGSKEVAVRPNRVLMAMAAAIVVMGVAGACAGSDGDSPATASGGDGVTDHSARSVDMPEPVAVNEARAPGLSDGGGSSGAGGYAADSDMKALGAPVAQSASSTGLPSFGPSVIKTADLSVQVPDGDFKDSIRDAINVAQRYGGFVVTTDVADKELGRGSVVLRIPAESFEAALNDLHNVGELKSENVSGVDVSQEFIDLQARLRNFEAQERVLRRLMNESTTVTDTLKVQSELQRVQLEIEQLKGRINYLSDQTDLGTITVNVAEAGAVATKAGVVEKAWKRSLEVATGVLSAVIVGAGFVIPVGIMLALLAFLVVKLRPRTPVRIERPQPEG